ncbi:GAF domain-containing protein [Ekhidna sp.]|uniref:GAF domain-containing protein n=1 Tax=Ekhidna sp. TaxID=2608089 RepID=UPI003B5047D3
MSENQGKKVESILHLTKSEALQSGKFKDFISELIPVVCSSTNALRASFWLYRRENDEFECIQSYDGETKKKSPGIAVDVSTMPVFKNALKTKLFMHIENNDDSEEYDEFVVDYLLKNRLRSWASIQVWNDNRLFGIITIEWQSKKDFADLDKLILTAAASMISQCYDALLRLKEDFLHRNEVSSLKVEEKEKEKLAKKLSDHAFYTSHSIRHPLATILALIDLIKLNWESREAYEELLQQLKIETMNLDDAIRVMTAKIELD